MAAVHVFLELLLVAMGLSVFISYHYWLIYVRNKGNRARREFLDYFGAGKVARALFAAACVADEKDAILGVQTIRNALTACSFIASIAAILSTTGLQIALDQGKIDRMEKLAKRDLIAGHDGGPVVDPTVVMFIALSALFLSFVCLVQSVRLYVHLGFYMKAVPTSLNLHIVTREEAVALAVRAGISFTWGLRLFFLYIPLVLWAIGPTAMCTASIAVTVMLYHLDRFDKTDLLSSLQEPQPLLQLSHLDGDIEASHRLVTSARS